MQHNKEITALLLSEFHRRVFDESFPRIKKCLDELSETEIWKRPNENTASVGNLVLHLCGNARQWIISGLSGEKDTRKRSEEFSENGPLKKEFLLQKMDILEKDIIGVIQKLDKNALEKTYPVQGFNETGVSVIVHVIEHFSYHTGQITLHTKLLKNIDTGYYKGVQLEG